MGRIDDGCGVPTSTVMIAVVLAFLATLRIVCREGSQRAAPADRMGRDRVYGIGWHAAPKQRRPFLRRYFPQVFAARQPRTGAINWEYYRSPCPI